VTGDQARQKVIETRLAEKDARIAELERQVEILQEARVDQELEASFMRVEIARLESALAATEPEAKP
jgi:hypothetical protein